MLLALFSVSIALYAIDKCTRIARVDRLIRSSRYKLFNLRDLLRRAAIDGTVDSDSWLFAYLDTSLTTAASRLGALNIFEIVYLTTKVGDEENAARVRSLNVELNRKGNERFKAIHEGFQKCLREFLHERHRAVGRVVWLTAGAIQSGQYLREKWKKRSAVALVSNPKISTLRTYCTSTR